MTGPERLSWFRQTPCDDTHTRHSRPDGCLPHCIDNRFATSMPPTPTHSSFVLANAIDQTSRDEVRAGYAHRIAQLRAEKQGLSDRPESCSCDVVFSRCFMMILVFGQFLFWSGIAAAQVTAWVSGAMLSLFAIATLLLTFRHFATDKAVSLVASPKIHEAHSNQAPQPTQSPIRVSA